MKITKEEKMYLERCGYGRKDFAQIQEATRRDKTTYEMDGAPIRTAGRRSHPDLEQRG